MARIAIIYYSSTGNTYLMAEAAAKGARAAGAEVRLRRVQELAPDEVINTRPEWRAHVDTSKDIALASPDDLEWCDGFLLGSPTRFGLPAAQLKQFIDQTGPKWATGKLQDKPGGVFCGAGNTHGGQESTLLALNNVLYHWGSIIVPAGYTDPSLYAAGGNPYGVSFTAPKGVPLAEEALTAAEYYGRKIATFAAALAKTGT
ncbi:NAD(P)H:quinone oxidoreductase [Pseudochelatococcus sp. B33]